MKSWYANERTVRRTKKKHMERLDLIGPKGEILDLDTGTINPDKPVKKPKRAANSDLPRKSKMRKLAHVLKEPWGI